MFDIFYFEAARRTFNVFSSMITHPLKFAQPARMIISVPTPSPPPFLPNVLLIELSLFPCLLPFSLDIQAAITHVFFFGA